MENIFSQPEFDKSALFIQEWMAQGREEGAYIVLSSMALKLLELQLGGLDEITKQQILGLPSEKLEAIGLASRNFVTHDDLQKWLGDNSIIV